MPRWADRWRASRSSRSGCGSPARRRPRSSATGARRSSRSSRPTVTRSAGCCRRIGGGGVSPPFELDNRNKRSVSLNLSTDEGRANRRAARRRCRRLRHQRPTDRARARRPRLRDACRAQPAPRLRAHQRLRRDRRRTRPRRIRRRRVLVPRRRRRRHSSPRASDLPYQRGGMGDHMAGMAAAGAVVRRAASPGSAPARANSCRPRSCASACTWSAGT